MVACPPRRHGITVITDDIGRKAISRADARRLLTERRESEARGREAAERQAIELDRQWRAQLERWYTGNRDP